MLQSGRRQITHWLRKSLQSQGPGGRRTLSGVVGGRVATSPGCTTGRPAGVAGGQEGTVGRGWTTIARSITSSSQENRLGNDSAKVKVLYDGHCPLCVKEIRLLMWANERKQTMDFVDISQPDYDPSKNGNISYEEAMEVMHVIGKDGQIHTRLPAMQAMYGAVGWGWVWSFLNLPGVAPLCDRAYGWFARNRLWLTRRDCETGTCNVKDSIAAKKEQEKGQ